MTHQTTDPQFAPRVRDDLVFRQLDEEWVVYDPKSEKLHVLNASAAVIWLCCAGESTLAEIVDAVRDAFHGNIDRKTLEAEVQHTVESFAQKGLLQ